MSQTHIAIRPTRNVRDLYRGRRYAVVAVFPGGRTIGKGKTATRAQAFKQALRVARPQTSPTAGGNSYSPGVALPPWKYRDDIDFY